MDSEDVLAVWLVGSQEPSEKVLDSEELLVLVLVDDVLEVVDGPSLGVEVLPELGDSLVSVGLVDEEGLEVVEVELS